MKLTYIYVKQAPSGLYYLGKTVKDIKANPNCYIGSGRYWLEHLKYYSYKSSDIKTWILHETVDEDELKNIGAYYSKLFNVVESDQWANLKPEEGDGGLTVSGDSHPMKNKDHALRVAAIRHANFVEGKWRVSDDTRQKMREAKLKNPVKHRLGITVSEDTKKKISETKKSQNRKTVHSPETLEKIRQAAILQHAKKKA
jgi:hypothetical protein